MLTEHYRNAPLQFVPRTYILMLFRAIVLPCLFAAPLANANWTPLERQPKVDFQLPWQVNLEGFDVKFELKEVSDLQIAFNYKDAENYYVLHLSKAGTTLRKIESGLVQPLAKTARLKPGKYLLRKRGERIELFENYRRRLRYFDATFHGGQIGFAGDLKNAFGSRPRMQQVDPLYFADDFMRGEGESGEWTEVSGNWQVRTLRNPLRSANAFKYLGNATEEEEARSLVGYWFWDNYRVSASVSSLGGEIGLLVAYQDEANYLKLAWSENAGRHQGKLRVIQLKEGQPKTLLAWSRGYEPNQWHRMVATLDGDELRVAVNGHEVGHVELQDTWGGKAGLFTNARTETFFDDVLVQTVADIHSDFAGLNEGRWQTIRGDWSVHSSGCRAASKDRALAVMGKHDWYGYQVTVDAKGSGEMGVVAYFQDPANYYALIAEKNYLKITSTRNGRTSTLSQAEISKAARTFSLKLDDGVLNGYADSKLVVQAINNTFETGNAGLLVQGSAKFSNLRIEFLAKEKTPLRPRHQVFLYEVSMSDWASAEGDWVQEPAKKGSPTTAWHRVDMPDNFDVRMPLPSFPAKDAKSAAIASSIGLNLSSPGTEISYALRLESHPAQRLVFQRGEETLNERKLDSETPNSLRLRRAGRLIIGYLNGRQLFAENCPKPLGICQVGWTAEGILPEKDRIQVFADGVTAEWFENAPTDWIVGDGLWKVSNRWQCDPRWSFFSGKLLEDDEGVAIWSRRALPDDFTVEVAIGQKMAREWGSYVNYARDYDVTICADGMDLKSGYSFVFGGWANKKTAIVRKSKVVAETTKQIINVNALHRKWYILKIRKRGPQLTYYIDGIEVLRFNDPKPLRGNRLAIWSHNNSLMIARVRISAGGPNIPAPPSNSEKYGYASFYHDEKIESPKESK